LVIIKKTIFLRDKYFKCFKILQILGGGLYRIFIREERIVIYYNTKRLVHSRQVFFFNQF